MAITTRRATSADATDLHKLAADTFVLATPPGTLQDDIEAFVAEHLAQASFERYLTDPSRIVLLAEDEDVPVGYAMLIGGPVSDAKVAAVVGSALPSGTDSAIELSKFYVTESSHGSGVASTLMAATLNAASATGARLCWLGVNQFNERAARFYAKHGFEVIGAKRFQVGAVWHDDHVRARVI